MLGVDQHVSFLPKNDHMYKQCRQRLLPEITKLERYHKTKKIKMLECPHGKSYCVNDGLLLASFDDSIIRISPVLEGSFGLIRGY